MEYQHIALRHHPNVNLPSICRSTSQASSQASQAAVRRVLEGRGATLETFWGALTVRPGGVMGVFFRENGGNTCFTGYNGI